MIVTTGVEESTDEELNAYLMFTHEIGEKLLCLSENAEYQLVAESILYRRGCAQKELDKRNLANRVTRPPGSR